MTTSRRHAIVGSVLLMAVLAGACGSTDENAAASGDTPTALVGVTRDPPLEVGGVSAIETTADGTVTPFQFRAPPGELLVVFFGYTACPDVCPTTMSDLRTMRRDLGGETSGIHVAMVTVDPDRDTPEVLDAYIHSFISEDVHTVRATSADELSALEEPFLASSSVELVDGEVQVTHTGTVYVVDDQGRVLVEWPFGTPSDSMVDDVRLLRA